MGENIFSIIFVLLILRSCSGWRSFFVRFESTECLSYNGMTDFLNCSIVQLKPNQEVFNLNLRFSQDIKKPTFDFKIYSERPNDTDFNIINLNNVDGCMFLQSKSEFNIIQIINKEFKKYSNLPEKCPIQKNRPINVKNLVMDSENFPPYLPETKFRLECLFKENNRKMVSLMVRGRFESKKKSIFKNRN